MKKGQSAQMRENFEKIAKKSEKDKISELEAEIKRLRDTIIKYPKCGAKLKLPAKNI